MARVPLVQAIQIAPELSREGSAGQQLPQLPSNGMGDAYATVSREFGRIGGKIGEWADAAARSEGADAGHLAGMDPEFRTSKMPTIRGEAFDKAGLQTALSRVRVGIQNDIEQAALAHQGNPAALDKVLAGSQDGWLKQSPPELMPEVTTLFAAGRKAAMRNATREMWARQTEDQKAAQSADLETSLRSVHQKAYSLGLDKEADNLLAVDVAKLEGVLGQKGPNGRLLVPPGTAAKLLANAKEEIARARLFGAFDRAPGIDAKRRMLDELDNSYRNGEGIGGALDLTTYRNIRGQLESNLRRDEMTMRSEAGGLVSELKTVAKWATQGNQPTPEHAASLKARIAAAAPELQPHLESALRLVNEAKALRQLRPEELEGVVRQTREHIRTKGATEQSTAYLQMADGMLTEMRTGLKTDALGWGEKVGLLKVAPVDFSQPETLRSRAAQAEEVARRYGQAPQYLRPDERRALAATLAKGGREALAVATAISQGAPEQAQAILGELDKKHAGHLALLGTLVHRGADDWFVRMAANGLAFAQLPEKKMVSDLKPADVATAADDVTGTALGGLPETRSAAIALTNHAYEMLTQQRGKANVSMDDWKALYRQALGERTVGGVTYGGVVHQGRGWFGGRQSMVVVPPNMRQDRFTEFKDSLRATDLIDGMGNGPRHGDGTPATLSEVQRATLIQAGGNRYYLSTGVDERQRPRVLLDGSGAPYVLDMDKIEPEMRRRRPDLYLGGQR